MALLVRKPVSQLRPEIYCMTNLSYRTEMDDVTRINLELAVSPSFNPASLRDFLWEEVFPSSALVHCQHCGQWAARKTKCVHCNGPVD